MVKWGININTPLNLTGSARYPHSPYVLHSSLTRSTPNRKSSPSSSLAQALLLMTDHSFIPLSSRSIFLHQTPHPHLSSSLLHLLGSKSSVPYRGSDMMSQPSSLLPGLTSKIPCLAIHSHYKKTTIFWRSLPPKNVDKTARFKVSWWPYGSFRAANKTYVGKFSWQVNQLSKK